MSESPTLVFRDGKAYAIRGGQVVAAHTDPAEVERLVELEDQAAAVPEQQPVTSKNATHVVTPNGLRGKILATPSLWGNEVTVRFANNQIATIATEGISYEREAEQKTAASTDPVVQLEARLAEASPSDRAGMRQRLLDLDAITSDARSLKVADTQAMDRLSAVLIQANHETGQVKLALDELELAQAEGRGPNTFNPLDVPMPDQRPDESWLQDTYDALGQEASERDFDEILREEPALLVDGLPEADVANEDRVRELALAHVKARTAGVRVAAEDTTIGAYHAAFVERSLQFLAERAARQGEPKPEQKTASTELPPDLPDEAIFLS